MDQGAQPTYSEDEVEDFEDEEPALAGVDESDEDFDEPPELDESLVFDESLESDESLELDSDEVSLVSDGLLVKLLFLP